jgi:hypothetical protein
MSLMLAIDIGQFILDSIALVRARNLGSCLQMFRCMC